MSQVFNGTSDKVYNTALPATAPPYSIAGWVKPTLVNGTEQTMLSLGYDDGTTNCGGAAIEITAGNKWAFHLCGVAHYAASTGPTANTWYHVCLTVSPTVSTLYVNGTSVGSHTGSTHNPAVGISRGAQIHNSTATTFYRYFTGEMAEPAVYNVALTSAEAATLAGIARGGDGATEVQAVALQKYQGLCDATDAGDNFWVTWSPDDTTAGTTFVALPACGGPPSGCGRNPLPNNLWLQASDWRTGPCTVVNRAMVWCKGSGKWKTAALVNTCKYVYELTVSGNNFSLKIIWASGTETITSAATACNPLVVSFLPTGTEFGGCGCNSFGGFTVQENQA